MARLKLMDAVAIPAAGTYTTDPIEGLGNVGHLTISANFGYGSGGTTVTSYVQTSLDGGVTWIDIASFAFTTANAIKVSSVTAAGALSSATVPIDGALTADTTLDGVIGDMLRVKYVVVGTYAASTLSVIVTSKSGIGGPKRPGTGASDLGKAEDAAHASGDVGVEMLGVRNENGVTLPGTELDYSPVATNRTGDLLVEFRAGSFPADAMTTSPATPTMTDGTPRQLVVSPYQFNGATYDRPRNNVDGTSLASAARTASTPGADLVTYNARGVAILIEVTANPGGAETLGLKLQIKLPSGTYADLADAGVLFTAANGAKGLLVYPGITAADLASGMVGKSVPIAGRTVRPYVTHSAAGSWTYRVDTVLLV